MQRKILLPTLLRDIATAAAREAGGRGYGRRVRRWARMWRGSRRRGRFTRIGVRLIYMLDVVAGQIVLADWRGDALAKEPNQRRPAVVVEDDGLFAPGYALAMGIEG